MENKVVDWESLKHAYGTAEDIPELLSQLSSFPNEDDYKNEPWFSLWSSLCHQGDIYTASFAAVPVIVQHLSSAPERATFSFFGLPALIDVARVKGEIDIPNEINKEYYESIQKLASIASTISTKTENELVIQGALAAVAVSLGQHAYAELILEIPCKDIHEVLEWYYQR